MTSAVVAVRRSDRGLDLKLIRAKNEDSVLREARHQGYLAGASRLTVTFTQPRRVVRYRRGESGKFEEEP